MFDNETYDPIGQENKIYIIVKGRAKFVQIMLMGQFKCPTPGVTCFTMAYKRETCKTSYCLKTHALEP